jgi:hypothetical protein
VKLADLLKATGLDTYSWPIPFHCSAECGQPIRQGDLMVQTSPDLRPLERQHAACRFARKGTSGPVFDMAALPGLAAANGATSFLAA